MRAQKTICLICHHPLEIRRYSSVTTRLASSLAQEPFVLPRLAIDLDVADSKYVRRVDVEPEKNKENRLVQEVEKSEDVRTPEAHRDSDLWAALLKTRSVVRKIQPNEDWETRDEARRAGSTKSKYLRQLEADENSWLVRGLEDPANDAPVTRDEGRKRRTFRKVLPLPVDEDGNIVRKLIVASHEEDTSEAREKSRQLWEFFKLQDRPWKPKETSTSSFKSKVPLNLLGTQPPDLLSYALLGDPRATSIARQGMRNLLFTSRTILPSDSAARKFDHLTAKFTTDEQERLRRSGFGIADELDIVKQIWECSTWLNLHRIVSTLSRTREGCLFLCRNELAIIESIRNCRKRTNPKQKRSDPKWPDDGPIPSAVATSNILRLLNNLQLSMELKGVQFGKSLCQVALYYAAKCCNLPAIWKYLQIIQTHSYQTNWRTVSALKLLFRTMKLPPKSITPGEEYNAEILRLITGLGPEKTQANDLETAVSFASILCCDPTGLESLADFTTCLYPRYLTGLGEHEQNDILWTEWKSENESRFPALIRGDKYKRFRARMFALAFLIGKDPERALEVLRSVPIDHVGAIDSPSSIHNWLPSNRGFARQGVTNTSPGQWLLALIYEHWVFQDVLPDQSLMRHLKRTIRSLPNDPTATLEALKKYILDDVLPADQSANEWGVAKRMLGLEKEGEGKLFIYNVENKVMRQVLRVRTHGEYYSPTVPLDAVLGQGDGAEGKSCSELSPELQGASF